MLLCASKRRPAVEHEFYVIIGHRWCGSSVGASTRTSGFGGRTRSFDCHRYHITLGIDISMSGSSGSSSDGVSSSSDVVSSSSDGVTLCSLKKWTNSSLWRPLASKLSAASISSCARRMPCSRAREPDDDDDNDDNDDDDDNSDDYGGDDSDDGSDDYGGDDDDDNDGGDDEWYLI